jgi:hypothetical protein
MLNIMSLANCKPVHVLEGGKSKTLTTRSAGKDVGQNELSLLVGMQNGIITLANSLAISYKN